MPNTPGAVGMGAMFGGRPIRSRACVSTSNRSLSSCSFCCSGASMMNPARVATAQDVGSSTRCPGSGRKKPSSKALSAMVATARAAYPLPRAMEASQENTLVVPWRHSIAQRPMLPSAMPSVPIAQLRNDSLKGSCSLMRRRALSGVERPVFPTCTRRFVSSSGAVQRVGASPSVQGRSSVVIASIVRHTDSAQRCPVRNRLFSHVVHCVTAGSEPCVPLRRESVDRQATESALRGLGRRESLWGRPRRVAASPEVAVRCRALRR